MSTSDVYCSSCGASNDLSNPACFACGKPLGEADEDNDHAGPAHLSSGALLHNRYLLLNPVGEGGFATVYRAEDTQSHKTVAIKSIGLAALNAQQMIDATDTYNRELLFGRALRHPHLPRFYDSFTDQEHWYLVVQYIDGPTLESYVQQRPARRLALWEVLDIGIQICEVLTYLHTWSPPVIFRDIKPDNIMRGADGTVYLVDFGIARHFRPGQRRDTQLLGSPGYAAPEQYGSAQTDPRSDLYSLGATLQTLLTGTNPLDNDAKHTFGSSGIMSHDIAALLTRMQAQKRDDRPASAQEVRAALEAIAHNQGISSLVPAMQASQGLAAGNSTAFLAPSTTYVAGGGQAAQMATYAPPPPPAFQGAPVVPPATPIVKRKRKLRPMLLVSGLVGVVLLCVFASTIMPSYQPSPQPVVQSVPVLDKHTLAIGLVESGNTTLLDPVSPAGAQEQQVLNLLYSGLTRVDAQNKIVPGLAQSWDARPSADGLDWTFHLRPNLKFSDGSPLTSSDVAYSIDRVFSSPDNEYAYLAPFFKNGTTRVKNSQQSLVGDSILTPDASTLVIKEQGRGFFLPAMMSTYSFFVVKQMLIKEYGSGFISHLSEGGSSGPFMFLNHTTLGAADMELVPNPFYYGSKPQLKRVSLLFYANIDSERADYKANHLSIILAPARDSLTVSEKRDLQVAPISTIDYIGMNYLTKPFDNIKIRQAFALALDKIAIMNGALQDGYRATNHIIPQGQQAYNPALTGPAGVASPRGDAVLAKRLLQQGMEEEGIQDIEHFPTVTMTYYSTNSTSTLKEMGLIQQQWYTVLGIKVNLEDDARVTTRIDSSIHNPQGLQLWFSGWLVDYPDPQNWTSLQFSKDSAENAVNYGQNSGPGASAQQQVQADLLKADAMQDPQQRLKAYQVAEQQLVNDVAWLPISQGDQAELVKPNVLGYRVNESGYAPPDVLQSISIALSPSIEKQPQGIMRSTRALS